MDARIVAVGSELLADRADTNGPEVGRRLLARGFRLAGRWVAPDEPRELAAVLAAATREPGLVVALGGLGPTDDDLTRDAVAAVSGCPLREDAEIAAALRERAARAGWPEPGEGTLRQALVPAGATVLPNALGSAPGLLLRAGPSVLLALPGPPGELLPMLEGCLDAALDELREAGAGEPPPALHQACLRLAGMGESRAAELVAGAGPVMRAEAEGRLDVSWLAQPGDVALRLRAREPEVLEEAAAAAREALGEAVYSDDGRGLAEVVVAVLAARQETVGTVESCTGGLLAGEITSVPGSSEVFRRGFVTYSNEAKTALAGVPPALLERHGAVSEETAAALAAGGRRAARADWTLAVTGVAGPGGGTPEKRVGLVCFGTCRSDGSVVTARRQFPGSRADVRRRAVLTALDLLRREL